MCLSLQFINVRHIIECQPISMSMCFIGSRHYIYMPLMRIATFSTFLRIKQTLCAYYFATDFILKLKSL